MEKKKDRPSPSESATLFNEGTKKKGNDGNMYVVAVDKNGTKRWKKFFVEKKDRPSPAKSATLYNEGTKMKGNDGNTYIVVTDKNGTKKWKKYIKKSSKKISLPPKKSNFNLELFFDLTVIHPKDINKYLSKNNVLKKIKSTIIPEMKKNKINFFIVPLPLSNKGFYWSDYANSYIEEFYDENYFEKNYVILTIYLNNDLSLNLNKIPILTYNLTLKQSQLVFDIFYKHLPYNYEWDGNDMKAMELNYNKKKKKIEKNKIKETSNYPLIIIQINLKFTKKISLFELGSPLNSKEFKDFDKIEKICKYVDHTWGGHNIDLEFLGVQNIKLIQLFFKYLKKKGTITFGSDVMIITGLYFQGFNTEEDV